jgi:aryl-alcohol dehydrogenase-like predicted oxidoreductase
MKKIEIIDGVYSSVLGFGCAPILGSISGEIAERAINSALDYGVNHFDLARSYGYGEAESFVGKMLKNRRNQVVIATKFGIKANWKSSLLKPLKPLVRYLKGHPKIKTHNENDKEESLIKVSADRFHDRLPITVKSMANSLELSLRALKTDYIDILFIHEPLETIIEVESILEFSEKMKKEGKIRGIGLACMQNQMNLHQRYIDIFDILQFNNSPGMENYNKMKELRSTDRNILFSPLNGGSNNLTPSEKLIKLNIDFPKSVILCSMFNEKHIKSNTEIFK